MADESYRNRLARALDNKRGCAEFAFLGRIDQAKRWGRGRTYVGLPDETSKVR